MLSKLSIFAAVSGLFLLSFVSVFAQVASPSSTNFIIEEWGFGSGGTATSSSTNFLLYGVSGEVETASLSSTNFLALPGLTYTLQPNIPGPTVTNPSNYYNKLHVVVNPANYPTDTTFAVQVASNSADFSQNVYYVASDDTLGGVVYFMDYSSATSGFDMIGLSAGTTYYVRVAAKRGTYQQGPWSPTANAATVNPTLSFTLQTTSQPSPPFSVHIGNLTPGSVVTSSDQVTATISTNATGGGLVYVLGTNNGLKSTYAGNYTIGSSSVDLGNVGTLEGYGARGTTTGETSGGPMRLLSPYDGASNNVGILETTKRALADSTAAPITNGQVSFELKAKAKTTTPSAVDYTDTLTVLATGSF